MRKEAHHTSSKALKGNGDKRTAGTCGRVLTRIKFVVTNSNMELGAAGRAFPHQQSILQHQLGVL